MVGILRLLGAGAGLRNKLKGTHIELSVFYFASGSVTLLRLWLSNTELLTIYAGIRVVAISVSGKQLALLVPDFRAAGHFNKAMFEKKIERPAYKANQMWNRKWSVLFVVVIFCLILPFCLTRTIQPC